MSVIVAEDDPDVAEVFTAVLNRSGHATRHATSGPQALRLVTERRPRLVVLDDRMPGMTGLDVARLLRTDPLTAALPLIMVASGPPPAAHDVFDLVLTKPVSSRTLLRAVEDLLPPPAASEQPVLTDLARLRAVAALLDAPPPHARAELDRLVAGVARAAGARMAAVTLTLDTSVALLASAGVSGLLAEAGGLPAEWAPCGTVTATGRPLLIADVRADPRYARTPLSAVYGVRSYAGVPLRTSDGCVVGSLCVMADRTGVIGDDTPARLSAHVPQLLHLLTAPQP